MVSGVKKLAFVGLVSVFGLSAALADDSYLYWMVGGNASEYDYTNVRVHAFDESGSEYLMLYPEYRDAGLIGYSVTAELVKKYEEEKEVGFWAGLTTYAKDGASFVIELYHDDTFLAQSEALFYSEALAQRYVDMGAGAFANEIWIPEAFAVPEPNSALLMLVGCAVLALRRRPRGKA